MISFLHRIIFLSLLLLSLAIAREDHIKQRLFITANICDLDEKSSFYDSLRQLLIQDNSATSLLINGDLIKGKFTGTDSLRIQQLAALGNALPDGQIIILSGDRDWDDSGSKGLKKVKKLEKYLESFDNPKINFAIEKGCPGPVEIELSPDYLLVLFNTQWWNHPYDKPGPQDSDCRIATTDIFKEELEDILDENQDQHVLIAGHFPVFSLGEYGGDIPLKNHIFPLTDLNSSLYLPLPVLGSFYASYRKNIGTSKDIINEHFLEIHEILQETIMHHQGIIYLSGHEQNLQILQKDDNYFINSGSPAKAEYAGSHQDALLAESKNGVIELILYDNGQVVSQVHFFSEGKGFYQKQKYVLYQPGNSQNENPVQTNTFNRIISAAGDEATTIAGEEYAAGSIKRFFWGNHYRDTWTKEIRVPFLNLDTTFSGLRVYKRGGGRQTKSLKFKAANGQRYSFRSVNKDPTLALPYNLRETIARDILKDQTSTQNPYGAMAADVLLNAIDILHAHPRLYIMPDDEHLKEFRPQFANMLGMLEENPSSPQKGEKGFAGSDKIYRSHQMFRKLYASKKNKVNTQEFVRARVFDILVGDWGKHEDNWKWAAYKDPQDNWTFRPIPRDRDHVFSRWDGLFPYLADREWAKESGEDFDYELTGIRSLMFQARHLDRFVANELSRDDWLAAADFVQQRITADVIEKAVRNMPQEIYPLSGKIIEEKLKSRIKDLKKYTESYYLMITDQVDVVGSEDDEYFEVIRHKDGSVEVNIYPVQNNQANKNIRLYSRIFYPGETKEIRLFGLDGQDIFDISGKCSDSILLRLIGGPERDKYNDQSKVDGFFKKTIIYENSKKASINTGTEAWQNTSAAPPAYDYDRTAFAYDSYMPLPFVSYNADDGFYLHLGYQIKTQSYGKEDYDKLHNFGLELATSGTFSLDYNIRFHHAFGNWDITSSIRWAQPGEVINIYGIGNNSINNDSYDDDFYKSRFEEKALSLGVIRDFWKQSFFKIGAYYLDSKAQKSENSYLFQNPEIFGDRQLNIIWGAAELDLDLRDNAKLPQNGMRLFSRYEDGFILNFDNTHYAKALSFVEHFSTADIITPVTLGLKAGLAGSYGKIPFFKLFSLGQEEFLRGYRKNRFIGKKMAFFNSDLRFHLLHWHNSVVPIELGIKGFFDTGKIIDTALTKGQRHDSWGMGMYFVPIEKDFAINISFAFSKEEKGLFTIGIGTAFN